MLAMEDLKKVINGESPEFFDDLIEKSEKTLRK